MKKLLTILLALLVLVGCGDKAPTWEDVQEEFEEIKQEAIAITANSETFLKADYLNSIDELNELVTNLEKSTEEENKENLEKIYKLAYYLQAVSSEYSGTAATKINNVAKIVDALIQTTYDGTDEEFAATKQEAVDEIAKLYELSDKEWADIEKKVLLKWEDVEEEYTALAKEARNDTTELKEVTEVELNDLKDIIIANYEEIQYGVTVFNQDAAKTLYEAAVKLEYYTRKTTSEEGKTVRYFAIDSQSYVKQCYGKVLEENEILEQDYPLWIADANKWTQSVWNIITRELKI